MASASIFSFIKSKSFRNNLLVAVGVLLLIGLTMQFWLSSFTKHGETIAVPDFRGMNQEKAIAISEENNLEIVVVDSLYEIGKKPGVILDQDPAPKTNVKEGRAIYVTLNASLPPKVKMPNLIDVSLRQAEAMLESYGLKIGRTTFKPDLAKNAVLEQLYKGSSIAPGKEINKGAAIDLVLGNGEGTAEVAIPDLTGLTRGEANFVLKGSSLLLWNVRFDPGVRDTLAATIYRQIPAADENAVIHQGETVDIYLK